MPPEWVLKSFSLTATLCNPSADNHCVSQERRLKVNIFPYLGDLGVGKSCHLEKFCFNNSTTSSVLCLRRKQQLNTGCPCTWAERRTVQAIVLQTIVSYLVFELDPQGETISTKRSKGDSSCQPHSFPDIQIQRGLVLG